MTWEFSLTPQPNGSSFAPELVSAMHAFWAERPTYRRSDGVYVLTESFAYRDEVIARGLVDRDQYWDPGLSIEPAEVTFSVWPDDERNREFYDFIKWVTARVPCEFRDECNSLVDLEYWLALVTGVIKRGPPN